MNLDPATGMEGIATITSNQRFHGGVVESWAAAQSAKNIININSPVAFSSFQSHSIRRGRNLGARHHPIVVDDEDGDVKIETSLLKSPCAWISPCAFSIFFFFLVTKNRTKKRSLPAVTETSVQLPKKRRLESSFVVLYSSSF